MAMLETPSRVWRRIEAVEDRDMPSLPSLPPFEDSAEIDQSSSEIDAALRDENLSDISAPIHSTPAAISSHTATSTIRAKSSTSSTARFASSIASRSTKSSLALSAKTNGSSNSARRSQRADSFDISSIPSLPDAKNAEPESNDEWEEESNSVPDDHLPPEDQIYGDQDLSLTDALQSLSRSSTPPDPSLGEEFQNEPTPKKHYEYSVSLRSEPKVFSLSIIFYIRVQL